MITTKTRGLMGQIQPQIIEQPRQQALAHGAIFLRQWVEQRHRGARTFPKPIEQTVERVRSERQIDRLDKAFAGKEMAHLAFGGEPKIHRTAGGPEQR